MTKQQRQDRTNRVREMKCSALTYREVGLAFGFSRQYVQQIVSPRLGTRDAVRRRANGRCERCRSPIERGCFHHRTWEAGIFNTKEGLEYLCKSCHTRVHHPKKIKPPKPPRILLPSPQDCDRLGICKRCRKNPRKPGIKLCESCRGKMAMIVRKWARAHYIPRERQPRQPRQPKLICKRGHTRRAWLPCRECKQITNRNFYIANAKRIKNKSNARYEAPKVSKLLKMEGKKFENIGNWRKAEESNPQV